MGAQGGLLGLILLAVLSQGPAQGRPVERAPQDAVLQTLELETRATCGTSSRCIRNGGDIDLRIRITNSTGAALPFPLQWLQGQGAYISLTNTKTRVTIPLRISLVSEDIKKQLVTLAPGESVELDQTIAEDQLAQFKAGARADIDFLVQIRHDIIDPRSGDQLRITGEARGRIVRPTRARRTAKRSGR